MIVRTKHIQEIQFLFETFPVVAILGPRQCGKSTLAKQYSDTLTIKKHHFDLESERDIQATEPN